MYWFTEGNYWCSYYEIKSLLEHKSCCLFICEFYGSNAASALLKGKSYNRGVRAHKLVVEAMFRLQWQSFVRWLQDRHDHPDNISEDEEKHLNQTVQVCRERVANSEDLQEVLPDLCQNLSAVQVLFSAFKKDAATKSNVFAFWNSYIDMIGLLLAFIRAERNGDWLCHLSAVAAVVPRFYAMDRTNYARWLPVYPADMNELPSTHPEVHEEFFRGNHSLNQSQPVKTIIQPSLDWYGPRTVHQPWFQKGKRNHKATRSARQMVPNIRWKGGNDIGYKASVWFAREPRG